MKRLKAWVTKLPRPLQRIIRWAVAAEGEHWMRVVMNRDIDRHIRSLDPRQLDAVEVGRQHGFRAWQTYTSLTYPDFDLTDDHPVPGQFDFVVTEQVLEHVSDPRRALEKLWDLCRPGGQLVISTPFMVRIHEFPKDFWRFSPDAIRLLLEEQGFECVRVKSWGNRACIKANLRYWKAYRPWHSLRNDEDLPLVVWAFAQRPVQSTLAA